jgi:hypothetical protein
MKDLIVLTADKNMEFLVRGLFPRIPQIEHFRNFNFDPLIHPHRDPGIYNEADEFLRNFINKYRYALVILDRIGCGREEKSREEIESEIENKLVQSGWNNNRVSTIAIDPELENWIWVNEIRMKEAISWDQEINIYDWLHQNNLKEVTNVKPSQPKEAFESALKLCRTPRSSSIYLYISKKASYRNCQDPAFLKMINQLKRWFEI